MWYGITPLGVLVSVMCNILNANKQLQKSGDILIAEINSVSF